MRLTEQQRYIVGEAVFKFLPPEDKALANAGRVDEIVWSKFKSNTSPLGKAFDDLVENKPQLMLDEHGNLKRSYESFKNTMKQWCIACHKQSREGVADLPRKPVVGQDLSQGDWDTLLSALVEWTWEDHWGQQRRHPDLEHAL